ncbi:MAG: hypothetical protein EGQ16_04150, partial [Clostridiales bacterium]|nr:hypothetical protein [Clostridiales bacterium]
MNNNLQKLEFNKILDILSSFCVTDNGKKLALELLPSNSSMEEKKLLAETEEAVNIEEAVKAEETLKVDIQTPNVVEEKKEI